MAGIAGGIASGAANAAIGGGSVLQGALMGGTIGALTGYYNSQGIIDRTTGPLWNGPNTLIGAGFLGLNGIASIPSLLAGGPSMGLSFGNGGLQITNAPLMALGGGGGFTLGHMMFYGGMNPGTGLQYSPGDIVTSPYSGRDVRLGLHEGGHVVQGTILGPLFGPAWLLFGGPSNTNPLELGADSYATGGSVWSEF